MNTSGVLPTPTGSEVNRLSREDGDEINNGNMRELLSQRGIEYIQRVIQNNIAAGCTFGVTSTFRVTPFRAHDTNNWQIPSTRVELPDEYKKWNEKLITISRNEYKGKPLLGNVCPITDTSQSSDDIDYANVGSPQARVELSRKLHDAQIRVIGQIGVDGILVEACRHPDDALGIAQSVREAAIPLLIVSFEANENGIPDPIHNRDGYNFLDMKADLQKEVGDNTAVLIGVNCVNGTLIDKLLDNGHKFNVAYPNQSDTSRFGSDAVKQLRTIANEVSKDKIKDALRDLLDKESETPFSEYEALIGKCLRNGVSIVGNCCGGRPEHVRIANYVFQSQKNEVLQ